MLVGECVGGCVRTEEPLIALSVQLMYSASQHPSHPIQTVQTQLTQYISLQTYFLTDILGAPQLMMPTRFDAAESPQQISSPLFGAEGRRM